MISQSTVTFLKNCDSLTLASHGISTVHMLDDQEAALKALVKALDADRSPEQAITSLLPLRAAELAEMRDSPFMLLKSLEAVWFVVTGGIEHDCYVMEDANEQGQRFCVARCNVTQYVDQQLADGLDGLLKSVSDNGGTFKVDERYYGPTLSAAYERAVARTVRRKHLSVNAFHQAFSEPLEIGAYDCYVQVAQELCTALHIIDDVNPDYWERTYDDELTPMQAVADYLKE
ncbi:hypothetical protein [Neptuniibacter sp. QD37_11]|uniref:hypothetical protein n=1 Tax=Neptuniibacter sp. QD37_11 TaxID=3398209 RepID=UPI0039F6140F